MSSKKAPSERDVELLLTFLVDKNERTAALAREQLKSILSRYPAYRKFIQNAPDPQVAHEARLFLEQSRLDNLEKEFRALASQGQDLDLEEGCYLLSALAYPMLRRQDIAGPLDQMAEEIQEILDVEEPSVAAGQSGALPAVQRLRSYLFDEMGFQGNEENYYDPDNSFLNRVMERRTGIPISLSCVYLLTAWRLEIPANGVGLPGHFIISHGKPPSALFLDPFFRGRILTRRDCIELVRQRGVTFQDHFLEPTPNLQTLSRLIVNLVNIYTEQGQSARARWLSKLLAILQEV